MSLVSNDATEATVPASVTILDGQASATFTITAVDDAIIDGTQTVTITAAAVGFLEVTDTIEVLDGDPSDTTPPTITAVYVSGSGWSSTFIDAVDGGGTGGGNGLGFELSPNLKIPTQGVNTIIIQFSEAVSGFDASNVALLGVGVADYLALNPASSIQYDPVSFRGTIVLNTPVSADRIRLAVNDAVTDPSGNRLDGNGDANAGGWASDTLFDVLVGDASGDGSTDGGIFRSLQPQLAQSLVTLITIHWWTGTAMAVLMAVNFPVSLVILAK